MEPIRHHFESLTEFADYCASTPKQWESDCSDTETCGVEWSGADSLAHAMRMAREGTWRAPSAKLDAAVSAPSSAQSVQRIELESDVFGVIPNIPSYCAGLPDTMLRVEYRDSPRRIVRVLLQRNYSADVDVETAIEAGAYILEFITRLELETNVTIELDVGSFTHIHGNSDDVRSEITITVKRAGQPVDVSELAFALACPAFLRRIMFRYHETFPRSVENIGHGSPKLPSDDIKARYDLFIPRPLYMNTQPVRDAIASYLTKLGA